MKERIIKNDNHKFKNNFSGHSKPIKIIFKSQNINSLGFSIFLLIIILLQLKNIHFENEITLIIKGNGKQQILSNDDYCCGTVSFNSLPDKIYVNGILQDNNDKYVYNLINQTNIITLKWINSLTNSNVMFAGLTNIIYIDLSKFDSSQITDIRCMFRGCTSLESLNLSNFNTSLVNNMIGVFERCTSLKFLDLKNFDTSLVTSMRCMFISCYTLKSLDLSNFNTSKVNDMTILFKDCISLIRLNVRNFKINQDVLYTDMFKGVNKSLIYCINDESEYVISSELSNYKKNCFYFCSQNSSKLIFGKNVCIDDCKNDMIYKFEYNNICYNSCPNETHISSYNNFICEEDLKCDKYYNYNYTGCLDYIPEGYYLNNSNLKTIDKCNIKCGNCSLESIQNNNLCITCNIINNYYPKFNDSLNNNSFIDCYNYLEGYYLYNNTYYQCYKTCKTCYFQGNKENHSCIDCLSNFTLIKDYQNNNNCYKKCPYYYYFDSNLEYFCTSKNKCPDNYNKLIINEAKCVNNCSKELVYKYEYNNTCLESCPNKTHSLSYNNYICEEDLICEKYYNYNYTECIEEIPFGFYLNDSNLKTIDKCDIKCGNCFLESVKNNNLCISCNTNNYYYPIFNDSLNNNSFINCYNKNQLTEDYILYNNMFRKCYQTCQVCEENGNKKNHKCIQCKNNFTFRDDFENNSNCYEICKYYYYFDSSIQYHCTQNNECPKEYNKLITKKNKCIDKCSNDNKYQYEFNNKCFDSYQGIPSTNNFDKECPKDSPYKNLENNECIKECSPVELFINKCKIKNNNPEIKNNVISNIKNQIINGELNSLISNMTNSDKKYLVISDENIFFQIATTDKQKYNIYDNLSSLYLDECEKNLRKYYNIKENEPLLIFKIDAFEEGLLIPKVDYELFNLRTKEQLNLSICQNTKIKILLPAIIEENEEYKHNISIYIPQKMEQI